MAPRRRTVPYHWRPIIGVEDWSTVIKKRKFNTADIPKDFESAAWYGGLPLSSSPPPEQVPSPRRPVTKPTAKVARQSINNNHVVEVESSVLQSSHTVTGDLLPEPKRAVASQNPTAKGLGVAVPASAKPAEWSRDTTPDTCSIGANDDPSMIDFRDTWKDIRNVSATSGRVVWLNPDDGLRGCGCGQGHRGYIFARGGPKTKFSKDRNILAVQYKHCEQRNSTGITVERFERITILHALHAYNVHPDLMLRFHQVTEEEEDTST